MNPERRKTLGFFTIEEYSVPDDSGSQPLWIEIKNTSNEIVKREYFTSREKMNDKFKSLVDFLSSNQLNQKQDFNY